MSLKKLQETRGAKVKELDAIFTAARKENRSLSADEATKYDGIEAEVRGLDANIEREVRHAATFSQNTITLSANEQRDIGRFDLAKTLRSIVEGTTLDGIEAEIVAEGRAEARSAGINSAGVCLPRFFVRRDNEQRAVSATGTTSTTGDQGGMTIATNKAGLVDDFYNASILRQSGATVMEGLIGTLDLPRLTAGSNPAKKTENASADAVSPLTAMLSLSPKRLPAYVDIGEQLLRQSSSAIEAIIRKSITSQMLAIQETAFFHGGGTNEANGIIGTSGVDVTSVVGGTNGAAPTFAHIIGLETAVDAQNALLGNLRYFSNGQCRGKLKQTMKNASGTTAEFILGDAGLVNGYQANFTNAISRTLTKGSSSVASAIFFGNAADYVIGYWGGLTLELIRDSANAKTGQYTLVAAAYYDGGVWRPKSFAVMKDALCA